jgi:hypothetical protein
MYQFHPWLPKEDLMHFWHFKECSGFLEKVWTRWDLLMLKNWHVIIILSTFINRLWQLMPQIFSLTCKETLSTFDRLTFIFDQPESFTALFLLNRAFACCSQREPWLLPNQMINHTDLWIALSHCHPSVKTFLKLGSFANVACSARCKYTRMNQVGVKHNNNPQRSKTSKEQCIPPSLQLVPSTIRPMASQDSTWCFHWLNRVVCAFKEIAL